MSQVLITGPEEEVISLDELKDHLRLTESEDSDREDSYLSSVITAARRDIENFLQRKLVTQTWDLYLDSWPDEDGIEFPFPPLVSVTSVQYKASDYSGSLTTWASTNYVVDVASTPGRLVPAYGVSWPTLYDEIQAVVIRFTCGYGTAGDVPENIRQAVLMQAANLYEHRGGDEGIDKNVDWAVQNLIYGDRMIPA